MEYAFEFIFINNGKKIGVRYTGLCAGEATELVEKYEIDEILQIAMRNIAILVELPKLV